MKVLSFQFLSSAASHNAAPRSAAVSSSTSRSGDLLQNSSPGSGCLRFRASVIRNDLNACLIHRLLRLVFDTAALQRFAALLMIGCSMLPVLAADNPNSIIYSKHNLSSSGPGDVRSSSETEICIFCHAPHTTAGVTPLWNHQMSATAYVPYSSATLKAKVGQPTGSSKLCLSCHDGTVALGLVGNRSRAIPMKQGITSMPAGKSRLGTDLSGHHPVSFTYDSALVTAQGELQDPLTLNREVRLDNQRQLQCTSCHDPHSDKYGKFLVKDNTASALCVECHAVKGWSASVHATSAATWNGSGRDPWPNSKNKTVAANGCENCHTPHAAGVKPALLKFSKPEDNCLVCHNGSVAAANVASEFNKPSAHPMTGLASSRDVTLGPLKANSQRVSCVDCHDPHTMRKSNHGTASDAVLSQVKGATATGSVVAGVAARESDLCFHCHSSSSALGTSKVPRQFSQPNTRLQFNPGNASFHPVLTVAKSTTDPTLISPWTTARQMLCSDCHNNDQGPGAKGTGPNGPHGSRYAPLLERNLVQTDFQPESPNSYALCYKCHNEGVLLSDRLHSKHVRDEKTSCSTCHDAHGVQTQTHLINFNTLYVKPVNGRISYVDNGNGQSTCTLSCHGSAHNSKRQ